MVFFPIRIDTNVIMQWALIELCRNDWAQKRLREELLECGSGDPTYEQIMNGLPFLDAVVHEVLRLHPPVNETIRAVCPFLYELFLFLHLISS